MEFQTWRSRWKEPDCRHQEKTQDGGNVDGGERRDDDHGRLAPRVRLRNSHLGSRVAELRQNQD